MMTHYEKYLENTTLIMYNLYQIKYYIDFMKMHSRYICTIIQDPETKKYWKEFQEGKLKDLEDAWNALMDEGWVKILDEKEKRKSEGKSKGKKRADGL